MVTFKQVNRFQYMAENATELIEDVLKLVEQLSGNFKDFIEQANRELFHTMLSRAISREFFKQITLPDNVLTVTVDVEYKEIVYTTSLGIMPDPEDGAKVKYVESYYIR